VNSIRFLIPNGEDGIGSPELQSKFVSTLVGKAEGHEYLHHNLLVALRHVGHLGA